jgi:23S rRNA pseudouridine2605 synthase
MNRNGGNPKRKHSFGTGKRDGKKKVDSSDDQSGRGKFKKEEGPKKEYKPKTFVKKEGFEKREGAGKKPDFKKRDFKRDDKSGGKDKDFKKKDFKRDDRDGGKDRDKKFDRKLPNGKKEVRSVFDKRKLDTPSDKRVQFIDGADINYRTRLDKKGFSNKNEERVSTMQVLDNTDIRLNKFIAVAGTCSRREADELIVQGRISVNGKEVTTVGTKVKPTDRVKFDGKLLVAEEKVYILLNKPKGFITTTSDPEDRKTVLDIVEESTPYRVFPVGRLDRNTTGVLLLTNDGDFMEQVTHPKYNITKIYKVSLDKKAEVTQLQQLLDGVMLEDGLAKADNVAFLDDSRMVVGIEIHSGKNRVIRRMFEHLDIDVKNLDRTSFGPFTKTNLRPGQFRTLNDKEMALVERLKNQKSKKKPKADK